MRITKNTSAASARSAHDDPLEHGLRVAVQVFDDKADDVLARGRVQFFPLPGLRAKRQRFAFLQLGLDDIPALIQIEPHNNTSTIPMIGNGNDRKSLTRPAIMDTGMPLPGISI